MQKLSITDQRRDYMRTTARECALLYAHCVLTKNILTARSSTEERYKELEKAAALTLYMAETALDQFYVKSFIKVRLSADFITKFEGAEREARTGRAMPVLSFVRPYVLDVPGITETLPSAVDVAANRAEVVRIANELLTVKAAGESPIPKVSTDTLLAWWWR
jgi:hypothetical protein